MADFLVLEDARASTPTGPVTLKAGRVISDSIFDIDLLRTQGVALIVYSASAMAPIVDAFRSQAGRAPAGQEGDLIALLQGAGLIGGGFELSPEGDHFDARANIHIGLPELSAELWVGGGGPFGGLEGGGLVLVWTETSLGVFENVSALNEVAQISFSDLDPDSALYVSAVVGSPGTPTQIFGLEVDVTVAAVLGAGAIVAEYWNGSAWVDFSTLSTDEDAPFLPYGAAIFERASHENVRFNQGISDDWTPNDPMGLGVSRYWVRFRVNGAAITTGPQFGRIRCILSATKINSEGLIEYFGLARVRDQFDWDIGLLSAASASPGNQDVFRSQTLDVGRTENLFSNVGGPARIGFVSRVPGNMCTSCPVTLRWAVITNNASAGNIRWVVRWGRTTVGDAVFRTSGTAPATAPNEQEQTTIVAAPTAADELGVYTVTLDVRDFIGRRASPGFPDDIWVSLERDGGDAADTHTGDVAVVALAGTFVQWSNGEYLGA